MSFRAFVVGPEGEDVASMALGGHRTVTRYWGQAASRAGLHWLGQLDGREVIVSDGELNALRIELRHLRMLWAEDDEVSASTLATSQRSEPLLQNMSNRADILDDLIDRAQQIGGSIHIG